MYIVINISHSDLKGVFLQALHDGQICPKPGPACSNRCLLNMATCQSKYCACVCFSVVQKLIQPFPVSHFLWPEWKIVHLNNLMNRPRVS